MIEINDVYIYKNNKKHFRIILVSILFLKNSGKLLIKYVMNILFHLQYWYFLQEWCPGVIVMKFLIWEWSTNTFSYTNDLYMDSSVSFGFTNFVCDDMQYRSTFGYTTEWFIHGQFSIIWVYKLWKWWYVKYFIQLICVTISIIT